MGLPQLSSDFIIFLFKICIYKEERIWLILIIYLLLSQKKAKKLEELPQQASISHGKLNSLKENGGTIGITGDGMLCLYTVSFTVVNDIILKKIPLKAYCGG